MKKIIFKILVVLFYFSTTSVSAYYDPTEKDFSLIDRIENRIYDAIDEWKITPGKIIWKIEYILENRSLSEKVSTILEILIEDIEYSYYISYEEDGFEMSADECFDDEYYDAETKLCKLITTSENNESYEDSWYKDEEDLSDRYADDTFEDSEEWAIDETNSEIEGIYIINEDTINLKEWTKKDEHIEIWEFFTKIIPNFYRKDFKLYLVYNEPDGDTFAAVSQDEEENTLWNIEVNRWPFYLENGEMNIKESIHTLIHEFAHVLTLGNTQVDYLPTNLETQRTIDRFKEMCRATFITEWCLKDTSYLEQFISNFWSKEEVTLTEEEGKDIYFGNEDKFVTDYASTNPAEDIAESFTYFVLKPKPTGWSIAEKKIQFFYQFEELVSLRNLIRNRIK